MPQERVAGHHHHDAAGDSQRAAGAQEQHQRREGGRGGERLDAELAEPVTDLEQVLDRRTWLAP
ncbi:MAG: hypothetical protein ACR2K2_05465 [Mycobacteriales bacterium]